VPVTSTRPRTYRDDRLLLEEVAKAANARQQNLLNFDVRRIYAYEYRPHIAPRQGAKSGINVATRVGVEGDLLDVGTAVLIVDLPLYFFNQAEAGAIEPDFAWAREFRPSDQAHALAILEAVSKVVALLTTGRIALCRFFAEVVVAGGAALFIEILGALTAITDRRNVANGNFAVVQDTHAAQG
jgi:hypothetical protein